MQDGGLATKRRESAFSIDLSLMLNEVDPCAGDSFDINQIAESFKGESLDVRFSARHAVACVRPQPCASRCEA